MEKTISSLARGFESSSGKTSEFNTFVRDFKHEFGTYIKSLGCTDIKYNVGHFEISVFFTSPSGQIYYLNTMDVRNCWGWMFVRTAKNYKDYTGGSNRQISCDDVYLFKDSFENVVDL